MDVPAFNDFFRIAHPKLVRYAQRLVDPSSAEDLASLTLASLWARNIPAPDCEAAHRKLHSLAYRVLDGHLHSPLRPGVDMAEQIFGPTWKGWTEPLSLTDRDVLELLVDGFKVAEIAEILDCPLAAVTMRLRRAKKNARLLWNKEVNREQEA